MRSTYVYDTCYPFILVLEFADAVFSIPSMDNIDAKSICIQIFTLQAIEDATDKFKTMIGEGGFGSVYRGTLPPGQEIAVKVRSATSTQGTREFENEVNHHLNLTLITISK